MDFPRNGRGGDRLRVLEGPRRRAIWRAVRSGARCDPARGAIRRAVRSGSP
jgi:hypothetical protein